MSCPLGSALQIGIYAFPVIPDSQSKQVVGISNFCFYQTALRMTRGISHRFARNPENVDVGLWIQSVRRSLHYHSELQLRLLIGVLRNKLVPKRSDFLRQHSGGRCRRAQVVNRVSPFDNCPFRSVQRFVERLDRLRRAFWEEIPSSLKQERYSLKAL